MNMGYAFVMINYGGGTMRRWRGLVTEYIHWGEESMAEMKIRRG
jgi:hypothetical protein